MKLLKIVTVCMLVATFGTSCKKYLDKKADSSLSVPTQLNELQALLDDELSMNAGATPGMGEASADDYFLLQATYDARRDNDKNLYRWIRFDYNFPNDWSTCYAPVYTSNYCLEMVDKIPVTNSNKALHDNIKGSAHFYRSYYFLQLAWVFAKAYDKTTSESDFGIALRLASDFNAPSVRANVKETYNQIIADAKTSIQYLPDIPKHTFRPSKSAAYALLSRTYLSMRDYDNAKLYADSCLLIKNDLMDYKTEIISLSSAPFAQFNKETIFYTEMNTYGGDVATYWSKVDTILYSTFENNDVRKTAFFYSSGGYFQFQGSYTGNPLLFTGIATDEVYLIRAECYARKGDKDNALKDLNTLLGNRFDATFIPVTANDANEALSKILLERRKELYWRGIRFSDIKRLNLEGAGIILKRIIGGQTYTLPPNDNRYALALPKDIINQSGMQQNPQ